MPGNTNQSPTTCVIKDDQSPSQDGQSIEPNQRLTHDKCYKQQYNNNPFCPRNISDTQNQAIKKDSWGENHGMDVYTSGSHIQLSEAFKQNPYLVMGQQNAKSNTPRDPQM
jgi:hypothetical protein